jgi:hypothetical protein
MTFIMCRVCPFKLRLTVSINGHAEYDVKQKLVLTTALLLSVFSAMTWAEVITTRTNNGNLVMQDIPEIPASMVASLNRYQNVRSAGFLDWTRDGSGIYVSTRFGDVSQVHQVSHAGGSEFSQIFLLDPGSDDDAI